MTAYKIAYAEYQEHKKICTQPYDPRKGQCPECGRLIEAVALAMVKEKNERP